MFSKSILMGAIALGISFFSPFVWAIETHYAVIGDAGKNNSNSMSVRGSIVRAEVTQLIMPGDNLYGIGPWRGYGEVWDSWKQLGLNFNLVAIGNHNAGYQKEIAYFGMPGEYYSKVENGARFIVLNSDNNNTGPEQAQWLDGELSASTELFVFVIYHHPSYTVSKKHPWTEKRNFQQAIRPILWKHRPKITALMVGHDHLATLIHFDDLPVVLSGAVQEVRKDQPVDNIQDGVEVKTSWYFNGQPHWAQLTIDPDQNAARVKFVQASSDQVQMSAWIETGKAAVLETN